MVSTRETSASSVVTTGSSSEPGLPDARCTHQPGPGGVSPSGWPHLQSSPCLRWKRGGGGAAPGAAGQQDSCSISSWRHGHPTPALAGPILRVSPHPPGWPACPAPLPGPGWALVHLSGTRRLIKAPRKRGQPAGAEEGPPPPLLWATSGFRAFLVPVTLFPQENQGLGYLT